MGLGKKKKITVEEDDQSSQSSLDIDAQASSVEISKTKMDVPKLAAKKKEDDKKIGNVRPPMMHLQMPQTENPRRVDSKCINGYKSSENLDALAQEIQSGIRIPKLCDNT